MLAKFKGMWLSFRGKCNHACWLCGNITLGISCDSFIHIFFSFTIFLPSVLEGAKLLFWRRHVGNALEQKKAEANFCLATFQFNSIWQDKWLIMVLWEIVSVMILSGSRINVIFSVDYSKERILSSFPIYAKCSDEEELANSSLIDS